MVSAIRIHTLSSMDFADITYSIPSANIFSGLEPSVAVILACIPLLRPLLGRHKGSTDGPSRYGASSTPSQALELKSKDARHFEPLSDDSSQYRLRPVGPKHLADVRTTTPTGRGSSDFEDEDANGITVSKRWKVDVVTSPK